MVSARKWDWNQIKQNVVSQNWEQNNIITPQMQQFQCSAVDLSSLYSPSDLNTANVERVSPSFHLL